VQQTITIISSQAFSQINFRGPLIKKLVQSGNTVYALAPDFDDTLRRQINELGATPVDFSMSRTGMSPLLDISDTIRLAGLLRQLKPSITLAYFIKPVIFATLAAWFVGVPRRIGLIEGLGYVFTPGNRYFSFKRRLLRSIVSILYRVALRRAHAVIFLNSDDIEEFTKRNIVSASKAIKIGGIGVDLKEWPLSPPVIEPVTFLLAARLLLEKGITEYAEAARLLKLRHNSARFILLGGLDSNPGGLPEEQINDWVAQGILEWPGHVDVKPWLAQASVFVLPSYREGVPRSTQEAMAMGRPVITTDVPGCRETVEEGVNGFFVPCRNSEALAQAMLRFITQPELIRTMGLASRSLAEQRFDVEVINTHMIDCLFDCNFQDVLSGSLEK
jgi:glycosyltransferase involved in cell wall biosynthesis